MTKKFHEMTEDERKEKYTKPIDCFFTKIFKGREKWSQKTKHVFEYSIEYYGNKHLIDWIDSYVWQYHGDSYYYEEFQYMSYSEFFQTFFTPNDVANMMEKYLREQSR